MKSVKFLTTKDHFLWSDYLSKLTMEQQDVYFTPEYYKLYEDNGDGKAMCFVFEKDGELALYPFLISRINDLGYDLDKDYYDIQSAYGYSGVVSSSYEDKFRASFFKEFVSFCKDRNIVTEFTRFHPLLKNHAFSEKYLNVSFDRKTIYIDLTNGFDTIYNHFKRSTKKQINRAKKRIGIDIEVYKGQPDVVDLFYPIYKDTMDRVKSTDYLYFNKKYFESLFCSERTYCLIALKEGNPISGRIVIHWGLYLHGHLSGTLSDYLKISPFGLIMAESVKLGKKLGCHFFHFGGGATKSPEDSVYKYKRNFSDLTASFFIGFKVYDSIVYGRLINQWKAKYSSKVAQYGNRLQCYRYIDESD